MSQFSSRRTSVASSDTFSTIGSEVTPAGDRTILNAQPPPHRALGTLEELCEEDGNDDMAAGPPSPLSDRATPEPPSVAAPLAVRGGRHNGLVADDDEEDDGALFEQEGSSEPVTGYDMTGQLEPCFSAIVHRM